MYGELDLRKYIREEYKKCASDPVYFMRKYVKIQNPNEGGTVPFDLYPFQEDTLNRFHSDRFLLILKSRQLGITTLVSAYSLWQMLFNSDRNILVISIKQEISKEIITKVRFANDHLPSWLKVPAIEDNRLSLRLKNGSMISATSSAKDAGRSKALSLLVLDEAAFIDEARDIWTSAFNTLSTGGRAIVLSTPNGVGNWFHEMWVNAEKKKNDFTTLRLPWQLHPKRDEKWREEQTKQLGVRGASQECFDGNTKIYTKTGLKPIKDIVVGEYVLTHTGKFKKVIKKINNGIKNTVGFYSSINKKISYVTLNHPFLTINQSWSNFDSISDGEKLVAFPNIEFENETLKSIDISKLDIKTKFKIISNKNVCYINDRRHKTKHKRIINFDYDLGYFIGLYLSEGWKEKSRVYLCFNYETELNGWVKKIISILENKFGIYNYSIRKDKTYKSGQLMINSTILSSLISFLTNGNNCYNKSLSKNSYIHSLSYYLGIIDGCFLGDGMVLEKYNKQFSTRSQNLLYDIKYLCSICGFSLNSQIEKKFKNPKYNTCYILSLLKTKHLECKNKILSSILNKHIISNKWISSHGILENNQIYSKIKKTNIISKQAVYNLEVEDDHSYVTEHFVVHNCDCDFLTSGTNVIDLITLSEYEDRKIDGRPEMGVKDPKELRYSNALWIWEYPKETSDYIVCADPARGDGSDYSAAHVLDIETLEQVAEFHQQLPPKEFGNILVNLATEYNDALLIVEYNGLGPAVLQQIIDRNYNNTFYSSLDLKVIEVQRQIQNMGGRYYAEQKKLKPGFTTTLSTRPLLISKLEAYFRERIVDIHSTRTITELKTFIWENGKAQAAENYHDDLIMALCLGLWVRDTALRLRQEGVIISKNMIDKISIRKPEHDVPIYTAKSISDGQSQWQIKTGNKPDQVESLLWLLR